MGWKHSTAGGSTDAESLVISTSADPPTRFGYTPIVHDTRATKTRSARHSSGSTETHTSVEMGWWQEEAGSALETPLGTAQSSPPGRAVLWRTCGDDGTRARSRPAERRQPHLINFYRWVKRGLQIEIELRNDKDLFYRHRVRFNELLRKRRSSSREAASLFYFLNRTGFNGLCRFNGSGEFNVPFGRYNQIGYVRDYCRIVRRSADGSSPALTSSRLSSGRDFVYADPPYDVEFTQYQGRVLLVRPRTNGALASRHPGPVVLVNQATDRIGRLYASLGFSLTELEAPRRINCNGDRTRR